jgi:hypothetical protein
VSYRPELSQRVLRQLGGIPPDALDALVSAVAEACLYPDDALRTFPAAEPGARQAMLGDAGFVTYLIDEARQVITLTDVTWAG